MKKILEKYGITKDDIHEIEDGVSIIIRKGIQKIKKKENWFFDFEALSCSERHVYLKGILKEVGGEVLYTTSGEASKENTNSPFLLAVAEKRAESRCVLSACGLFEHGVIGEDEVRPEPKRSVAFKNIQNKLRRGEKIDAKHINSSPSMSKEEKDILLKAING